MWMAPPLLLEPGLGSSVLGTGARLGGHDLHCPLRFGEELQA